MNVPILLSTVQLKFSRYFFPDRAQFSIRDNNKRSSLMFELSSPWIQFGRPSNEPQGRHFCQKLFQRSAQKLRTAELRFVKGKYHGILVMQVHCLPARHSDCLFLSSRSQRPRMPISSPIHNKFSRTLNSWWQGCLIRTTNAALSPSMPAVQRLGPRLIPRQ